MVQADEPHTVVVLRKVFADVDTDGSGYISEAELAAALADLGLNASKAAAMIREADDDGDGAINFSEFQMAMEKTFDSALWLNYKVCAQPLGNAARAVIE